MRRESLILLLTTVALVLIGVLMICSATGAGTDAARLAPGGDLGYFLRRHALYAGLGLAVMFVASRFDYRRLREPLVLRSIVLLSLGLLVAVFIPGVGVEVARAQRWIRVLGFRFQPSEFAKFALILLLAAKLAENQAQVKSFKRGFLPNIAITIAFAGLILLERDLGVPVVLISVGVLMMLMAGARWVHLIGSAAPLAVAVAGAVAAFAHRSRRIEAWLNPWQHRGDGSFQLWQSLAAFARGGIWGRGPGASEQKLQYLPAAHTDFIYAVWAEETGLVGSLLVVALFATLLTVSVRIALRAPDLFGTLLAGGIAALIALEAVINMAVAVGLAPTKGLPLPFVSWGGSALIVSLGLVGVLLNIGIQARPEAPRKYAENS
ncbi:MAG TPA: putative lipid II flippase FtsW [Candidatus Hydrogenedentes bacterium]|nr:putative lipid II flippase FtsW [Candidatus Hydrogenedentota bacterium]HIJ74544.1 putative lipid II flippase FtsW [Candidatus Hydrogenedentota bacterium]